MEKTVNNHIFEGKKKKRRKQHMRYALTIAKRGKESESVEPLFYFIIVAVIIIVVRQQQHRRCMRCTFFSSLSYQLLEMLEHISKCQSADVNEEIWVEFSY